MATEKQRKTFLSYSRTNKDFAIRLAKELKAEGFLIWLDQLDIPLGARWDDEVEKALVECEIFMVILTPSSSTSDNVKDEIGFALDSQKRILPVLLENASVPLRLRRLQYVDFTSKSFDEGVESAKELLRNLIAQSTIPRMELSGEDREKLERAKDSPEALAAQKADVERLAKMQAERLVQLKAEEELAAKAKAEEERKAREASERAATQNAAEERIAKAKADEEHRIREEAERIAAQKLEQERRIKEEAERIAAQKLEEERLARTRVDNTARQEVVPVPVPAVTNNDIKTESRPSSRKPASRGLVFGIASVVVLALAGIGYGVFGRGTAAEETPTVQPTIILPTPTEEVLIPVSSGPVMEVGSRYDYVDGSLLIAVPAGAFTMGGNGTDNPAHEVTLADYWIYSTEVTNQQYALCVSLGKCTSPAKINNPEHNSDLRANDPVTGVTYEQAANYCSFVKGRLPTEAEWEKAAQNLEGGRYPWGDTEPTCSLLNFNNCNTGTTSVVSYPNGASSYGAFDMSGNAFEWVADWYDPDYYSSSPGENPKGPQSGVMRSVRSSSFGSTADQVAISSRNAEAPETHSDALGFRCVVEEPTYFAPFCERPAMYPNAQDTDQSVCPQVGIEQVQYCEGSTPRTNVTFVGPTESTIESQNCKSANSASLPNLYTCQGNGVLVSISAACEVSESASLGDAACPSGYSQQGDICVANPGQTDSNRCLAGEYDSSQQCCSVPQAQEDLSAARAVCSVGTFYSSTDNACLPYPVQEIIEVNAKVSYASCAIQARGGGGGGGADDNSVAAPAGGCNPADRDSCVSFYGYYSYYSAYWDESTCTCYYY